MVGYHYNSIVYFSTQRLESENYHYAGGKVEGGRGILPYHEKRQSVFGKGKVSNIRITIFAECFCTILLTRRETPISFGLGNMLSRAM